MENAKKIKLSAMEQRQLDMIESAENIMLGGHHSFDCSASASHSVEATGISQHIAASDLCNDDKQIEMATDETTEATIKTLELLDVNDDCLSAIFERLPILDLVSVADVCKRFRSIAQENFELAKPSVKIPRDVYIGKYEYDLKIPDEEEVNIIPRAAQLFRNFGAMMTKLEVQRWGNDDQVEKIYALISEYCGQNLVDVTLWKDPEHPIGLKSIFHHLKKLEVVGALDAPVLDWLTDIEDLTLYHTSCEPLLECYFEKLKRVFLYFEVVDGHDLSLFLLRNRALTDISLDGTLREHTLELPAQIEKLYLNFDPSSHKLLKTSSFKSFKYLKTLELRNDEGGNINDDCAAIVREIVAGNIELTHLTLNHLDLSSGMEELSDDLKKLVHLDTFIVRNLVYHHVDDFVELSGKLHRVTEWHVMISDDSKLTEDDLVMIVSSYSRLKRLRVCFVDDVDTIIFDSKSLEKFVAIVQKRNNHTRLDIELEDCYYKLDIPDVVADQYRHIVSVKLVEM